MSLYNISYVKISIKNLAYQPGRKVKVLIWLITQLNLVIQI